MKLDKIINVPEARIIFLKQDLDAIQEAAFRHYDFRCKEETLGIVAMLRHQLSHSTTAEITLTQTQVGLMAKACEQGSAHARALLVSFTHILNKMNEAYRSNNAIQ